ncbi:MAG: AAA family ATPase [Burkholderiales bacterium]|nr:AAA family ATPase [Burkholderiales bacterium]
MKVLEKLAKHKNVLISGAPATGKTFLLQQVARAFLDPAFLTSPSPKPAVSLKSPFPIVPGGPAGAVQSICPAPSRTDRKIFSTAFHQTYHPREFLNGLRPDVAKPGGFVVVQGKLFAASEHARTAKGASLLIVDELNRGPAVRIFGGAIAAIEGDKRLAEDGTDAQSVSFEITNPLDGKNLDYRLPAHLYILAAMNKADVSVEPLDVAFLRRWTPYDLRPEEKTLRKLIGVEFAGELPAIPTEPAHVLEALIRAWAGMNQVIAKAKGRDYELGHGSITGSRKDTMEHALRDAVEGWERIYQHVSEIFFGDARALAAVFRAEGKNSVGFAVHEEEFADEFITTFEAPAKVDETTIYPLLLHVAANGTAKKAD